MDSISPDEYTPGLLADITAECDKLLVSSRRAVVAMSSGGCARYAFSMDVDYCLDRKGVPLVHYASDNAHHHLIVTNSTMDFRIVKETSPDGIELSIFILTGMLSLVDPGDHDNLDRYARYFDVIIENYSSGKERLYRLTPTQARLEFVSGKQLALPLSQLIHRNPWTPGDEMELLNFGNALIASGPESINPITFAGVDTYGADIRESAIIKRLSFEQKVSELTDAQNKIKKLIHP